MKKAEVFFFTVAVLLLCLTAGSRLHADVDYVSLETNGIHYDIVSDSSGTIHMIWTPTGPTAFNYGTLEGATVTSMDTIPSSAMIKRARTKPRLAVQHGGESVHVVWNNNANTVMTHAWRAGGFWESPETLFDGAPDHRYDPMIAVCPDGSLHVIFQHQDEASIAYLHKPVSGSWGDEAILYSAPPPRQSRDTFIVCDGSGTVHAGWNRSYRYAPDGGDFEPYEALPNPSGGSQVCCGDMAIGADGTVHYALKAFPMQTVVYTQKPPSGSWTPVEQASLESGIEPECEGGGGYEVWPSIAVGDNGKVYIVWAYTDCSADQPPFVKMAVRDTDGSWEHVDIDSDASIPQPTKPAMAKSGGIIHLIWTIDGNEIVLHTIDTTVEEPEPDPDPVEAEPDAIEEPVPDETIMEEADPAADTAVDMGPPDTAGDTAADLPDAGDEPGDIGETTSGCGCRIAS